MANFKTTMSIEEILDEMNKSHGNTEIIHAGPCFLQYKLQESILEEQENHHKELLENQNSYNNKQLFWTRFLAIATWALVGATILLVKFN